MISRPRDTEFKRIFPLQNPTKTVQFDFPLNSGILCLEGCEDGLDVGREAALGAICSAPSFAFHITLRTTLRCGRHIAFVAGAINRPSRPPSMRWFLAEGDGQVQVSDVIGRDRLRACSSPTPPVIFILSQKTPPS